MQDQTMLTVGELIEVLSTYAPDTPVRGTWETTVQELEVYQSADGVVLIDADAGVYRDDFVFGRRKGLNGNSVILSGSTLYTYGYEGD